MTLNSKPSSCPTKAEACPGSNTSPTSSRGRFCTHCLGFCRKQASNCSSKLSNRHLNNWPPRLPHERATIGIDRPLTRFRVQPKQGKAQPLSQKGLCTILSLSRSRTLEQGAILAAALVRIRFRSESRAPLLGRTFALLCHISSHQLKELSSAYCLTTPRHLIVNGIA